MTFDELMIEKLQDKEFAIAYLNEALNSPNKDVFLLALRRVAEAQGESMSSIAKKLNNSRSSLYKTLSPKGNPKLHNLNSILDILGLKINISFKQ